MALKYKEAGSGFKERVEKNSTVEAARSTGRRGVQTRRVGTAEVRVFTQLGDCE